MDKVFGGKGADEYQAIYDAIHECGKDMHGTELFKENLNQDEYDKECVYRWLEGTPRTSMTVELVDKLHKLGFKIVKADRSDKFVSVNYGFECDEPDCNYLTQNEDDHIITDDGDYLCLECARKKGLLDT